MDPVSAATVATLSSLAGAGMSAAGQYEKGAATAAGDQYQAARLERSAEIGRVKAAQTSGQMVEKENDMLGTILAQRAAMHGDPMSPTGAAILQTAEDRADRQREITIGNIDNQADQDRLDANYERYAAGVALDMGELSAGASLLSGAGSFFSSSIFKKTPGA